MRNFIRFCIALTITLAFGVLYFTSQPAHAQNSCVTQPAGAVAWYPGDGNANDIVRGNTGTLQGNATYAAGKVGQAFSFDGDRDAVSIGNPEQLRLQNFTLEAWVKRASTTQATIDSSDAGLVFGYGQNGYALYLLNNGRLGFGKIGVNEIQSRDSGNFPELKITDTNFHHVAVVRSSDIYVTFYLDGVASYRQYYDTPFEFTTNAAIGGRGDNFKNSLLGTVDELTIYNRALDASDVQTIYNTGAAGKCKATSVQFEHATYPSAQTSGTATITVTRTGDTSGASNVQYATSDGTAKAGVNYTATSGTLNFAAGEQLKTITVPILNNAGTTTAVNFQLVLSNASGASIGATSGATLNIFYNVPGPGRLLLKGGNYDSLFLQASNTDGSNNFKMTPFVYRYGSAQYPSVSKKTGTIAFQGCGSYTSPRIENAPCERIFAMNADGSNLRQVTTDTGLDNPSYQQDIRPVISPDGTKIAFISSRPPAEYNRQEVFVINTDGTNLRQISPHQKIDDNNQSVAYSVVWNPDSSTLLVEASRLGKDSNNNPTFLRGLYTYNTDGTGETQLISNIGDGGTIDWSPDGRRILYVNRGGPYHEVYGYVLANPQNPSDYIYISRDQLGDSAGGDQPGSVRFSPDSQKIVYGTYNEIRTINIDGTNRTTVLTNFFLSSDAKWWQAGAAIPKPDHLTLTPDPAIVYGNQSIQITPTLYDAAGNVIFHSAEYDTGYMGSVICDTTKHPCSYDKVRGYITAGGRVYDANSSNDFASYTLCGSNGGASACSKVYFNIESLTVTAAPPSIRKSGADGASIITVKRAHTAATPPAIAVRFTLSGQAVRDTDYYLTDANGTRINGNAFNFPAGQTSFDIKVVPLLSQSAGDRDVKLTIESDEANYAYVADGSAKVAIVTIKDDHPEQGALTLSSITPNKGGDTGNVTVTVYGANIKQGATVKLRRNGQTDITGANVNIASNGTSLTAAFDLNSKAQGLWSIVVTNPDNKSATLADVFTIEAGRAAKVWADIVGRFTLRTGYDQQFFIAFGNTGNSDAPTTQLSVTIPKGLFAITELPEYPIGTPAVLTDDGTSYTLYLYARNVPAGSANYIPFRLKPLAVHQGYQLRITATTSSALQAIGNDTIDPTASLAVDVTENTASSVKLNLHVNKSSGNTTVPFQLTRTSTTTPREQPLITITENNGILTFRYEATVSKTSGGGGVHLLSERRASDAHTLDTPSDVLSLAGQAPGRINADGSVGTNYAGVASGVLSTSNAAKQATVQEAINDYLFTTGLVDPNSSDGVTLKNLASAPVFLDALSTTASLPGSPVDAITGGELSALTGVVEGGWALAVHRIYTHDETLNIATRLGLNDPNLTKDELIARLTRKMLETRQPPQPPPPTHDDTRQTTVTRAAHTAQAYDPNDKSGPQGVGASHYVTGTEPSSYAISFENKPEATAPAQDVVITDQLDVAKFDLSTFQLGPVNFGNFIASPPLGLSSWTTDVDLRPSNNIIVHINAGLDKSTGLVRWTFTSLDPVSGQHITDARGGFLPPNKISPEGQGGVLFSVMSKAGLTTGAEIRNKSRIIFDRNAPIDTNEYLNTTDNSAPTSRVQPLATTQSSVVFNVAWSGTDTGSGISGYDVYVAENGGSFKLWKDSTTGTSATFIGKPATRYDFYSIARDAVGNLESNKATTEATTTTTSAVQTIIDDARFFVRQHYLDFLNREPDQSGWDYWTSLITKCATTDTKCINSQRVSVSAAFFIEQEFQDTGSYVYRFYKGSLARQPNYAEFTRDRGSVIGGANLEASKVAFADAWTQRPEFLAKYPATLSSQQFVDALLQTVKQTSSVDLTGQRQTFINQLQASGGTRGQVIRAVVDTKAFQAAEYNRAFVLMQYFGYLRRDPDTSGYNFWLDILNNRVPNNYRSMVCAFINSAEYQLRFGSTVTRTDQVCSTIGQ